MKQIYLSILSAASFAAVCAQPVINAGPMINSHGTVITRGMTDYEPPAEGGADVVWDYSHLTENSELSYTISQPAGFPGADLAPQATHAIGLIEFGQFIFYEITEDFMSTVFIKIVSPQGELNIPYDPAVVNMAFPMQEGATWTAPYARTTDFGDDIIEIEEGIVSGIADGYGTLILPDGEYEDVVRITVATVGSIQAVVEGDTVNTVILSSITEMFINEDYPFGLLQFESTSVGQQLIEGGSYEKNMTVSVRDEKTASLSLEVFPNPAADFTSLRMHLPGSGAATAALYTLEGKQVLRQDLGVLSPGTHQRDFNLGHLPAGIYLMELTFGDRREVRKLAVR